MIFFKNVECSLCLQSSYLLKGAFLDIFNDASSLLWGFGITDLPKMSPGLLLISVIVQARTSPWRTKFANVVELLLTAFLMVRPGRHIGRFAVSGCDFQVPRFVAFKKCFLCLVYPWTLELFCFRPEDTLGCFAFVGAGYQGVFQHLGLAPLHSNSQPDPHRFGGNVEAGLEGISAVAVIGSEDTFLLDE